MNLLLLEPSEVDTHGAVELSDRRARHVLEVLRARPGRRLRVGITDGRLGFGVVASTSATEVALEVTIEGRATTLPPPVRLILALPRPKVLSRVLQTLSALGVRHIDIVNAWRVEKSYFGSPRLTPDALRADLLLGAEQAATPSVPTIEVHRLFVPFVQERLVNASAREAQLRLLAHPMARSMLEDVVLEAESRSVDVAVGPEGGWVEAEVNSFCSVGFQPVALCSRVLRVETAVTTLLAQLELLRRLRKSVGLPGP